MLTPPDAPPLSCTLRLEGRNLGSGIISSSGDAAMAAVALPVTLALVS
jgi:hypothetical protein